MADTPPDAVDVQAALRLGWLLAEVRGRVRPGSPGADFVADMARGGWALPLGSERSPAERGGERLAERTVPDLERQQRTGDAMSEAEIDSLARREVERAHQIAPAALVQRGDKARRQVPR